MFTEEQQKFLNDDNNVILVIATSGAGKGLYEEEFLIRSNGQLDKVKNIEIGDYLFGDDGKPTKVIGKYLVDSKNKYKIIFSDRNSVICCGEHLWKYQTYSMRGRIKTYLKKGWNGKFWDVKNTDYIYNNIPIKLKHRTKKDEFADRANIYLPMSKSLEFDFKKVPLDPWLLGVLIGDGTLLKDGFSFTNSEKDIIDRVKKLVESYEDELKIRSETKTNEFRIVGKNIYKIIQELGLLDKKSYEKFIPDVYKYNTKKIRFSLLQGLFDTDGHVSKSVNEYVTSSEKLSEDFCFLAESLGMTVVRSIKEKPVYFHNNEKRIGRKAFRLYVKCNEGYPKCYSSEKHLSKYKKPQSCARRFIESIEKLENFEGKFYCFEVDNESHLYLLNHCIPTHNTTSMIGKIERYIDQGIDVKRILFCSFTRKAANEIKQRLRPKLENKGISLFENLWIGTIHSSCIRILRYYPEIIGFSKYFTIADDTKKERLVKLVLEKFKSSSLSDIKTFELLKMISQVKNSQNKEDKLSKINFHNPGFSDFYISYNRQLKLENSMDFDDILNYTYQLLLNDEIRPKIQSLFDVVMVDEFQDVNFVQYEIFRLLVQNTKIKYIVVGDDDQSIYSFRGSDIGYILNHESNFKDCSIHRLSINHRCPRNIVALAEQIILPAKGRREKSLLTAKEDSYRITYDIYRSAEDEAEGLCNYIKNFLSVDNNFNLNRVAVLCRVQSQTRVLEQFFIKNRIPYKITGAFSFYKRIEVKDILDLIKLFSNQLTDEIVERWINKPSRGIGEKTIKKLKENNTSLWETLKSIDYIKIPPKAKKGIVYFLLETEPFILNKVETLEDCEKLITNIKSYLKKIDYYSKVFEKDTEENKRQRESNVIEILLALHNMFQRGYSLQDFFDYVLEMESSKEDTYGVNVMTMHASKGLEFDTVFIVGLQDNLMPHKYAIESNDLDNERRLLYVAMTRAENRLLLSSNCGYTSRFISAIKNRSNYLDIIDIDFEE